tara:strand:- start:486 stop:812 length:327 start_codon:yes stop_codon:yes gene_type:complete
MKLKKLLEGYAWERTPGKALPTMADVARKYNQNLREEDLPMDKMGMSNEDGNVVSRKFDLIMKDKPQFQKIAKLFKGVSVIKQVDFLTYLLDVLGSDSDTKKKLKMKL